MDKRLGRIHDDSVTLPEVSISGKSYDSQQDRRGLGEGYFVILDRWLDPATEAELIAEVKATLKPKRKAKANDDTE